MKPEIRQGVIYAVAACVLWGTAFLAPIMLKGWSPWAVAGGRYVAYGLIALVALMSARQLFNTPRKLWLSAFALSLLGNAVYYLLLSASLQMAGAFAPSVIIGTLPITLALAGRALDRQHAHTKIAIFGPLCAITAGLILVNWQEYSSVSQNISSPSSTYLWGIAAAIGAHIAWLLFGLWNAAYLKRHAELSPALWNNLLGASLLPVAVMMLWWGFSQVHEFADVRNANTAIAWPTSLPYFVIVVALTGLCSGWLATLFWSKASRSLPVSLAAQLIVIETLSSIAMNAAYQRALPAPLTLAGSALLVIGVAIALKRFSTGATA